MQSIEIRFLCVFLFICSASCLHRCGEFNKRDHSKPLPFQHELEQLFRAYSENNMEQVEDIYKYLENIDLKEYDEPDETNATEFAMRINFVPSRIEGAGYPTETHEVITDDGYILHLFRVPHGKTPPTTNQTRPPILLMHGLLDSANGFIVLGSQNSLAYLLADAGYDVWLGNARGTEPSRAHVRLRPTGFRQKKFWQFSWHEIGFYDLPAIIDHILIKTKQEQLSYIGFSQGTTSFFIMASERPEYNDKLLDVHLMAPVASLKDIRNKLYVILAQFYTPLKKVFEIIRLYKITISNKLALAVFGIACKNSKESTPFACRLLLEVFGSSQINCTSLPDILAYTPAGASIRQIIHYGQMIRNGDFKKFDYDNRRVNRRMYGQYTPPAYNLTKITAPVTIYYSKDDDTATMQNAIKLRSQLPNFQTSYLVPSDGFGHVDFAFSRFVKKVLYDKLISNCNSTNQL